MKLVASPSGLSTAKIYLKYFKFRRKPVFVVTEPSYEKAKEKFIKLLRDGKIRKSYGPVGVCPGCGSVSLTYIPLNRDTYYVLFRGKLNFLGWITNIKYLPGVTALAVDPEREYCLFKYKDTEFIAAKGFKFGTPIECFKGKDIGGEALNPVNGFPCKIVYIPLDERGTGIVPLAPAHSSQDYAIAKELDLPILNVITSEGRYTKAAGPLAGENVFKEEKVKEIVGDDILFTESAVVKIPVCGKCESEALVVFGETWYAVLEPVPKNLIPKNFSPIKGERRIVGISRFPMPIYVCPVCGYEGPESKICPRCGEKVRWNGLYLDEAFVWGATMDGDAVFGNIYELSWASALSEFDYGLLAGKMPHINTDRFSNIVRLIETIARREGICFETGLTSHTEPEDRWLLSLLQETLEKYILLMDSFRHERAVRIINDFVRIVSKKYIPLVRARMWLPPGDPLRDAVYQTLYNVIKTLFPMMAPFDDDIDLLYKRTIKRCVRKPTVYELTIPNPKKYLINKQLEREMETLFLARKAFLRLRNRLGIPLRHPLLHANVEGISLIRTFLRSVNVHALGKGDKCETFPGGKVCTDGIIDKEGAIVAEIRRRIQVMKKEFGISPYDDVIVEIWSDHNVLNTLRKYKKELERRINGKIVFSDTMSGYTREYSVMGHYVKVVIGKA